MSRQDLEAWNSSNGQRHVEICDEAGPLKFSTHGRRSGRVAADSSSRSSWNSDYLKPSAVPLRDDQDRLPDATIQIESNQDASCTVETQGLIDNTAALSLCHAHTEAPPKVHLPNLQQSFENRLWNGMDFHKLSGAVAARATIISASFWHQESRWITIGYWPQNGPLIYTGLIGLRTDSLGQALYFPSTASLLHLT